MADSTIQVRDVSAERGTKQRGFLKVGETGVGPIQIPLVIINGARPGPTLCITGGVHAAEYPALTAVMQTSHQLDPQDLAGAVIAIPVINIPMYQARAAFLSPIDSLNLNRVFPGRPDGSITEVIARTVLTEVVSRADYHIDCHGGDLPEQLWPYAGYALSGNSKQDEIGETMIRLYTPRIFALYKDGSDLPATRGSLTAEASRQGIPSMLAECGSAGGLDPADVQTHMNGIANVMRYFGMVEGKPHITGDRLQATGQFIVYARRGGLLRLQVGIGQELREGQVIGEIHDLYGDVVETLRSPGDGIVRLIWTPKVVNSGDSVLKCWTTRPAPAFPPLDQLRV